MDFRKLSIFVSLALFTGVAIFLACSSTDEPPVIFPSSDEVVVSYISSTQTPPTIDGKIDEGIWDAAELAQLISVDTSEYNPNGNIALLNVLALSDSTNLYIAVSWKDETRDVRYRQWIWDSVKYNDPEHYPNPWRYSVNFREDNIAFFFDPDPNGTGLSPSTSEPGPNCAVMCHESDFVMYNEYDTPVDGWYWRAGVTNPIMHALDLDFVDSLETDSRFLGVDAEENSGYILNVMGDYGNALYPLYWHKVDTTIVGNDTSYTIYDEESLFPSDTVAFQSDDFTLAALHEQVDSAFVPSYVLLNDASGSRWDVEAAGFYSQDDGRWTVEFKRALDTGNPDDIVFQIGNEYGLVVAIGNNNKQHTVGYDPVLLKF